MSYVDLLAKEGVKSNYLIIVKPSAVVTGLTDQGGDIWKVAFTLGEAVRVWKDTTALTKAANASLSDDEFYYDLENQELFVRVSGGDPTDFTIVAEYELHVGTFDAYYSRDPSDNDGRVVYYEPLVQESPEITSNLDDSIIGFLPSQSATLRCSNLTEYFTPHLFSSSFRASPVEVWHYLEDLEPANLKRVFRGVVDSVAGESEIRFILLDQNSIFDREYRNPDAINNFYGSTAFPNVNPQFRDRPIRTVFGEQTSVLCVNVNYSTSVSDSTNEKWVVATGHDRNGLIELNLAAGSTTTILQVTGNNLGFRPLDSIKVVSGANTGYAVIIAYDPSGSTIEITPALTFTPATGATVTRAPVQDVRVIREDGVRDPLMPFLGLHYDVEYDATRDVVMIVFDQAEMAIGQPRVGPQDQVYCKYYGPTNDTPIGSDSDLSACMGSPVPILYKLLLAAGVAAGDIDNTSFSAADALTSGDEIAFNLPFDLTGDFPTIRDLITRICTGSLLRLFVNSENKWALSVMAPISSANPDYEIEDDEILRGSFSFETTYADMISDAIVAYGFEDVNRTTNRDMIPAELKRREIRQTNPLTGILHRLTRQKTFNTFIRNVWPNDDGEDDLNQFNDSYDSTVARKLAERLSYIFGERQGRVRFLTKNRFFNLKIGDRVRVARTGMAGGPRVFSAIGSTKELTQIEVQLDDQKGVQDNEGDW